MTIDTNFIRTLLDCGCRVALERHLHEMSSEQGSLAALQTFNFRKFSRIGNDESGTDQ